MKILSCNIRDARADDWPNDWAQRRDVCAHIIRAQMPDVICFQEMQPVQYHDLLAALPGYKPHVMHSEHGIRDYANTIFYRESACIPLSGGGYWLSSTPHIPHSKSWGSVYERTVNWAVLQDLGSGATYRIINTHLDDSCAHTREEQAKVILHESDTYAEDCPQLLVGDMNADEHSAVIKLITAEGWRDAHAAMPPHTAADFSYHAFLGEAYPDKTIGKIDWIFTRGKLRVIIAEIIRDNVGGVFPSDHYFISADITDAPGSA